MKGKKFFVLLLCIVFSIVWVTGCKEKTSQKSLSATKEGLTSDKEKNNTDNASSNEEDKQKDGIKENQKAYAEIYVIDESGKSVFYSYFAEDSEIGQSVLHSGKSYFADYLVKQVVADFVAEGYSEDEVWAMFKNDGLKIYSTVEKNVQKAMEDYFENPQNFNKYVKAAQVQAAMIVTDVKTCQIRGIVGGTGTENKSLNRAADVKYQPGSAITPISVYGPAMDVGVVTPDSVLEDTPINIGGWEPKNSNSTFRGKVSVKQAISWSYNIPAIRVLQELTTDTSFDYLKNKLHLDSLVEKNDKNLASLSLGGLSNGITVLEMTGAYAAFANEGKYIEPHIYSKVCDSKGKVILKKTPQSNRAFSSATARNMNQMLKSVVDEGTGVGAKIPHIDTFGKTGTTAKNQDRWFIGYTPYYVASVWFGYDEPQNISSMSNPAVIIWNEIMTEIHK